MSFLRNLHPRSAPRGTSLLFVVVILALLAIVGVAIVNRASREGDSAVAKRQYDKSLACADAARELLSSQFRLYGVTPTSLKLNTPIEDKTMISGHYDSVVINSVTATSGSTAGALGVSDISNRVSSTTLGGQLYRMSVVCSTVGSGTDGGNSRQSEVEYLVRFGL